MAVISTAGLTKRFPDGTVAVDDLGLTVEAGEIFGFLGPNGAGKTTTINVLMDYVRPTDGTATVLGYDAQASPRDLHRRIGVLPDGFALYDRLTARRHITFAIESKGSDDREEEILERVGLRAVADRRVGGLSRGMRQRLALGMAIVGDPDLLVLDEPQAGLDPHGIRELRTIIRDRRDRGAGILFSSHVLAEVEAVSDRVGILAEGRLIAVDTIDGLRDRLGAGTRIDLTLDRPLDDAERILGAVRGVTAVSVDDTAISVECGDATATGTVLSRIESAGRTVITVETGEASLEDLFAVYTGGGRP